MVSLWQWTRSSVSLSARELGVNGSLPFSKCKQANKPQRCSPARAFLRSPDVPAPLDASAIADRLSYAHSARWSHFVLGLPITLTPKMRALDVREQWRRSCERANCNTNARSVNRRLSPAQSYILGEFARDSTATGVSMVEPKDFEKNQTTNQVNKNENYNSPPHHRRHGCPLRRHRHLGRRSSTPKPPRVAAAGHAAKPDNHRLLRPWQRHWPHGEGYWPYRTAGERAHHASWNRALLPRSCEIRRVARTAPEGAYKGSPTAVRWTDSSPQTVSPIFPQLTQTGKQTV